MQTVNIDSLNEQIAVLFNYVRQRLDFSQIQQFQLAYYMKEHSAFSKRNPSLLGIASQTAAIVLPLSAELKRNQLEEDGTTDGKGHYDIYSEGIRRDLGLEVESYEPSDATSQFLNTLLELAVNGSPSSVCGVFYATEAAATPELEVFRDLSNLHVQLASLQPSGMLRDFFDLHLNGVEQEHQDGLAVFVRNYKEYGLDPAQIQAGFDAAVLAMYRWWDGLSNDSSRLLPESALVTAS